MAATNNNNNNNVNIPQFTDMVLDYVKELRDTCNRLDAKMDTISDRITKLEMAVQNLSHIDASTIQRVDNIDAKYDEAVKRLHVRIDEVTNMLKESGVKINKIEQSPVMIGNSFIKGVIDKVILIATGSAAAYLISKIVAGFHG